MPWSWGLRTQNYGVRPRIRRQVVSGVPRLLSELSNSTVRGSKEALGTVYWAVLGEVSNAERGWKFHV